MTDNLRALAAYRLDQAREAVEAARILLREGSLRASVNRSYYGMFYAVLALLALRKQETSRHSGAIALFNRLFVHEGLLPKELSKWLRAAFDLRTQWRLRRDATALLRRGTRSAGPRGCVR
ncbi:MAG: HEPN domain-containing protein [Deltaproteobacteria bacterium]|nr:HEPN domain-containing protein [Deltaproteobacteria bacterium]